MSIFIIQKNRKRNASLFDLFHIPLIPDLQIFFFMSFMIKLQFYKSYNTKVPFYHVITNATLSLFTNRYIFTNKTTFKYKVVDYFLHIKKLLTLLKAKKVQTVAKVKPV